MDDDHRCKKRRFLLCGVRVRGACVGCVRRGSSGQRGRVTLIKRYVAGDTDRPRRGLAGGGAGGEGGVCESRSRSRSNRQLALTRLALVHDGGLEVDELPLHAVELGVGNVVVALPEGGRALSRRGGGRASAVGPPRHRRRRRRRDGAAQAAERRPGRTVGQPLDDGLRGRLGARDELGHLVDSALQLAPVVLQGHCVVLRHREQVYEGFARMRT